MAWLYGMAAVATLLVGFLAGLLTFKQSSYWCPSCGLNLRCPNGHARRGRRVQL